METRQERGIAFKPKHTAKPGNDNRLRRKAVQRPRNDDRFRHMALDMSKSEIRLLHVRVHGERRQYKIQHYELKTAPAYRALSYEWGNGNSKQKITIGGKFLDIRSNLSLFLDQFCHVPRDEYLWIDQITIDQGVLEERNHQVSMMADIYSSAQQVIIWIPFVNKLAMSDPKQWQIMCRNGGKTLFGYSWWMAELLMSSYWHRVWIIEEVVLARSIEVFYGDCIIQWSEVVEQEQEQDMYRFQLSYSSFWWLLKHATTLNAPEAERLDLMDVLSSCSGAGCSDLRDIVYGIQALIKPSQRVAIDYTKPAMGVFLDAAGALFAGFCQLMDKADTWQPATWTHLSSLMLSLAHVLMNNRQRFQGISHTEVRSLVSLEPSGERTRAFRSLAVERLKWSI